METKTAGERMTSPKRTTDSTVHSIRAKTDPPPLFYSLKRFMDHEECISAGSKEICRASFVLDVVGEGASSMVKRAVEGKLDTCGSVSLSHSSHLQDVKDCKEHTWS